MNQRMFRSGIYILLVMVMILSVTCFAASKTITLRMPIFAQQDIDYFTNKTDLVKTYQKTHPNVKIELEIFRDNAEFANAMTIRKAANELPELLPLKGFDVAQYADSMIPLDGLQAAKLSKYPYKDKAGKIVALPQISFAEFTYYRKSIFKEYGIAVPKTWDEYVAAAVKIKNGGKYIPIAMGAKDEWPDYPYNEFGPQNLSGDANYWNKAANDPNAFAKNGVIYKSYAQIKKLYDAKVFGQDPLGIGFDQAKAIFAAGKAGMITAGQWFLPQVAEAGADMSDVGVFLTPFRTSVNDPLTVVGNYDLFLGISSSCKNPKEAKEFVEWFFSKAYYPGYITAGQNNSTIKGIDSNVPALKGVFDDPKVKVLATDPYSEKFLKLCDITKFNAKKVGIEIMIGKDIDEIFTNLDKAWKEAMDKVK